VLRTLSLSHNEFGWASDRGELRVSEPAAGVVLLFEKGHLSSSFSEKITGVFERAIRGGSRPHLFIDCERLLGYDPVLRTHVTAWAQVNHTRVAAFHLLVCSHIAKMGFAVSNLALNGLLHGYTERRAFQVVLDQTIARVAPTSRRVLSFSRPRPA
jgi:hypothetical protein